MNETCRLGRLYRSNFEITKPARFCVILDAHPDSPVGSSSREGSVCVAAQGRRCAAGGTEAVTAGLTLPERSDLKCTVFTKSPRHLLLLLMKWHNSAISVCS